MPITPLAGALTTTVKVKDFNALVQAFNTLEADHLALKAQLVKGDELRTRLGTLEEFVVVTRGGLQALFTLFHPDPEHTDPEQVEWSDPAMAEQAKLFHTTVMHWIDKLGGRADLAQPEHVHPG